MSKRIDSKSRSNRIGRLDSMVVLRYRDLKAPTFGAVDFDAELSDHIELEARVRSSTGSKMFRGVAADIRITHFITIRYVEGVSDEMWIELYGGKLLDILNVENLDEQDRWLVLTCSKRGDKNLASARV